MKIWINRAGQNLGTFTLEEVQRGLNQGQFVPGDLGWQEGMETWKPLAEFPGLRMPQRGFKHLRSPRSPQHRLMSRRRWVNNINDNRRPQDGPAWERRKDLGLFKALTQTWKEYF